MIINKGCLYFRECTKEESIDYEKDYDIDFFTSLPSDFRMGGKIGIDSFIGYPIHTICATPSGGVCATTVASGTKKFFIFWID